MQRIPSRRHALCVRLHTIASMGALIVAMLTGGFATSVKAQQTRLVPLGPSQDTPARQVSPAQGEGLNMSRLDTARNDGGWGNSLEMSSQRQRSEQRSSQPDAQVVRRIAYGRPLEPVRVSSADPYEVRQAAYQPTSPADTRPSLAPGDSVQPSGTWSGSSSVPMSSSSNVPSFSPSPWTSSSGMSSVTPNCSTSAGGVQYNMAPTFASPAPTEVRRFAVTSVDPCAPVGVPVAGSVPRVQAGFPPLLPITRPPRTLFVSSGLLGQPVLYAPGQPIRNFFRYFTF
jgi:hypothetical protein